MTQDLKTRILENTFVDQVRAHMTVDEAEYDRLRVALTELATSLKGCAMIDRELMLSLYSMPTMVRNAFEGFSGHDPVPEIAHRLEDIWIELDELVTDCLAE
jgi:hypothetical protein